MQILQPVTVLVEMSSPFSLATTVMPPFLGTHCTGLTHELSEIGYMIPASSHLRISFFTTSFMIGFNLLCCSTEGLLPSSMRILC